MKKVRFLHVPKTAGSTFANCLKRIYGANFLKGNYFTFKGNLAGDLAAFRALEPSRRAALVLVTGHAPLVTGEPDIDALPTVTFLRDPVERLKSFLQHLSEGKSPLLLPAGGFDLDALLAQGVGLDNAQTRFLLGVRGYDLPDREPAALAEEALAVLEHRLAAYGIAEHFEESLLVFRRALGWGPYPVYTSLNRKSPRRLLAFTEGQLEKIHAMNEVDIRLYHSARARFQERLGAAADYMRAELRRLHLRQTLAGPLLAVYQLEHALRLGVARRRAGRRAAHGC